MDNGCYLFDALFASVSQPLADNRSNSIEIKHHNETLFIPRITKFVQYGRKYMLKQPLKNSICIKGHRL